jgi:hypothetical protein
MPMADHPETPELTPAERRVVDALAQLRATDRAPARLRTRLEAEKPSRRTAARVRVTYGGALAGALAAVVLALVLLLPAGTPGAPSVSQAAALGAGVATAAAPGLDPSSPAVKLTSNIQDVYFPNWSQNFGWRAVGQRSDVIGGRHAVTVYYEWHADRIAYTIVGAPALSAPAATVTHLNGVELRTLTLDGRQVVTWQRSGHTCVLSGNGVPVSVLRTLAAWQAPGLGHDAG